MCSRGRETQLGHSLPSLSSHIYINHAHLPIPLPFFSSPFTQPNKYSTTPNKTNTALFTTSMSSAITTSSPVETQAPAIAFAPEPERRGRDDTVTPLEEEDNSAPTTETKKKSHRGSLAAFAERFRSRSRSQSRQRTPEALPMDRTATSSSTFSTRSTSSRMSSKSRSGSRVRSSMDEVGGPYADVLRAQTEFMEKLRDEQERNGVTRNVDGLPIPPRSSPSSRNGSRRSSVAQVLGLDKPLLAF